MLEKIFVDDVVSEEEIVVEVFDSREDISVSDLRVILDEWFSNTVRIFSGGRTVTRSTITDREFENIVKHNVMSGTDVSYSLMSKFTCMTDDEQLATVLRILRFLAFCRLPKEYAGGFLILMVKHHILPS